jgi:hypothetical protein
VPKLYPTSVAWFENDVFTSAHSEQNPVVHVVPHDGRIHGKCDKCQELQKKIERYRKLAFSINDQLTIDRFNPMRGRQSPE